MRERKREEEENVWEKERESPCISKFVGSRVRVCVVVVYTERTIPCSIANYFKLDNFSWAKLLNFFCMRSQHFLSIAIVHCHYQLFIVYTLLIGFGLQMDWLFSIYFTPIHTHTTYIELNCVQFQWQFGYGTVGVFWLWERMHHHHTG